jgi:class 3 adenylate cyclase
VIGRVVNIASRLEGLAKARDVELALSRDCAEAAGLAARTVECADLRGLDAAFPVVLIPRVADLARENSAEKI